MSKKLKQSISYRIIYSKRKTIGISITQEKEVIVRAPIGVSKREIQKLVQAKSDWIEKHLTQMGSNTEPIRELDPQLEKMYREMATDILNWECDRLSKIMGVTYNKVTIRDQKSRWGSCSSNGNINLNWRLLFMHPKIARYVVVHELAHRKHMNHSKDFWNEVERTMPDYRKYRALLKQNGYKYIRR